MDVTRLMLAIILLGQRKGGDSSPEKHGDSSPNQLLLSLRLPQAYAHPAGKNRHGKSYLSAVSHLHRLPRHLHLRHKAKRKASQETLGKISEITLTMPENYSVPLHVTWHGNSFIPYNYRCQTKAFCRPGHPPADRGEVIRTIDAISTGVPDPCVLVRWNYELPFTEFPNMVAGFLAFDMISGDTTPAKSRFLLAILKLALETYMTSNSSADIFALPADFQVDSCKFRRSIEPTMKSLYDLLNVYSARQTGPKLLFKLTKASKACLDKHGEPFPLELLPCLDFSFGVEQLAPLRHQKSIFANPEICRKYLRYNISKCIPEMDPVHPCTEEHLIVLNSFARKFYQCPGVLQGGYGQISVGPTEADSPDAAEYYYVDADINPSSRKSAGVILGVNLIRWSGYLLSLIILSIRLI